MQIKSKSEKLGHPQQKSAEKDVIRDAQKWKGKKKEDRKSFKS